MTNKTFDSSEYPLLVNEVMSYVIEQKERNNDSPIIDVIADFCIKYDYPVMLVGDAIADDVYFKSLIESDCEFRKHDPKLSDW